MLEVLKIRNLAVIDEAEIPFKAGLNILSGETGAGKSIIIEAISLILGSRASADLVRSGCDEAVIEGLFDISQIQFMRDRLKRAGFEDASQLLIKRIVSRTGRHRIYVNGELATLAILQDLCEGLVDLCGQHEHQTLLRTQTQLELLDRYGGLTEQSANVGMVFSRARSLRKEVEALEGSEDERRRKSDYLKYQIEELRAAELRTGEDEELQNEKQLLQSSEARIQQADAVRSLLEGDGHESDGVLDGLRTAVGMLRDLARQDERVAPMVEAAERAIAETEELGIDLNRYLEAVELNPDRLQEVQDRLAQVAALRRKYGATVADMLATLQQLEVEADSLEHVDERLEEVRAELIRAEAELRRQGQALSAARKKIASVLADSVTGELKDLKMGEAKFQIELSSREDLSEWTASAGADVIQFVIRTNRGEAARPLGKVASGGELSRLMLAIRRVIADRGGIGVYLFDEVDTGIGGQTAFEVGRKLKSVAAYNQVICITHLPQVASFAQHHLSVRKLTKGKRTVTEVVQLGAKEDRMEELARMLAGPKLTKSSLQNAAELLDLAK